MIWLAILAGASIYANIAFLVYMQTMLGRITMRAEWMLEEAFLIAAFWPVTLLFIGTVNAAFRLSYGRRRWTMLRMIASLEEEMRRNASDEDEQK